MNRLLLRQGWGSAATALILAGVLCASASAQPNYDFDWATIDDPGNPAYEGDDPAGLVGGRGSVDYVYRISKLEVTTAQWLEFVNTFATQGDQHRFFAQPSHWGAVIDGSYQGPGRRYRLKPEPDAERWPVSGISWREAGLFANWLHNGKGSSFQTLETGAYDTSTWGDGPGREFTDDFHHLPGARFWIPTLDEWMKAVHYDPDRHGSGEGGWWLYPNGSDEPLVGGPPGEGQTSAGYDPPGFGEWDIPLGAYPDVASPWGLLDASGGAQEWLEEVFYPDLPEERGLKGAWAGIGDGFEIFDRVYAVSSGDPRGGSTKRGLRIVSVPAPSALLPCLFMMTLNRRRKQCSITLD